jgi:predicted phosphohydrolase
MPKELPDDKDTILILAGDIWIGTKFIEYAGFSWISVISSRFKQVLIVLGNHDYWPCNGALSIKDGADKCNSMLQDVGIFNAHVLDMSTVKIDNYLFIGATLWTDMYKMNPLAMHNMSNYMRYDGKIAYYTGQNGAWERFTSQRWVQLHYKHREYIRLVASQNPSMKIIVITHHLPLHQLGDPNFANDSGTAYYVSDLSDLILDNPNIKLWACGHSHVHNDKIFGETRMYMNPVGYSSEQFEKRELIKHETLEV